MAPFGKIYSYPVSTASFLPRAKTKVAAVLHHRLFEAHVIANWILPKQGNPRTTAINAVAKANNIELEQVHTEPAKGVSDDYRKLNKLGKVPTFEGADGYVLSECMAIAI